MNNIYPSLIIATYGILAYSIGIYMGLWWGCQ